MSGRVKGGKLISGIEWEPSIESITNIYPRPFWKSSNALEELGYELPLEDTAHGVLLACAGILEQSMGG
jgi:hypothetical protein